MSDSWPSRRQVEEALSFIESWPSSEEVGIPPVTIDKCKGSKIRKFTKDCTGCGLHLHWSNPDDKCKHCGHLDMPGLSNRCYGCGRNLPFEYGVPDYLTTTSDSTVIYEGQFDGLMARIGCDEEKDDELLLLI